MNKPTCCGKLCQPVKKTYGKYGFYWLGSKGIKWAAGSIILGFRCRVCKRFGVPFLTEWDNSYMDSLPSIHEAGLAFDASFTT